MENRVGKSKAFFPSSQHSKIFCRLRNHILKQFKNNLVRFPAKRHIKENLRVTLRCFLTHFSALFLALFPALFLAFFLFRARAARTSRTSRTARTSRASRGARGARRAAPSFLPSFPTSACIFALIGPMPSLLAIEADIASLGSGRLDHFSSLLAGVLDNNGGSSVVCFVQFSNCVFSIIGVSICNKSKISSHFDLLDASVAPEETLERQGARARRVSRHEDLARLGRAAAGARAPPAAR